MCHWDFNVYGINLVVSWHESIFCLYWKRVLPPWHICQQPAEETARWLTMQLHWITTYPHYTGVPYAAPDWGTLHWIALSSLPWTHWTVDRLHRYAGEAYWRGKILLTSCQIEEAPNVLSIFTRFQKFFNRKPYNPVEGIERSAFFSVGTWFYFTQVPWHLAPGSTSPGCYPLPHPAPAQSCQPIYPLAQIIGNQSHLIFPALPSDLRSVQGLLANEYQNQRILAQGATQTIVNQSHLILPKEPSDSSLIVDRVSYLTGETWDLSVCCWQLKNLNKISLGSLQRCDSGDLLPYANPMENHCCQNCAG